MFSLSLDNRQAKLMESKRRPGRYELSVDGIPQSVVSMTEPTALEYPYIQHIARAIDAAALPDKALRLRIGHDDSTEAADFRHHVGQRRALVGGKV